MRNEIENLLNLENPLIKTLYNSWDKCDCSEIGLAVILLKQLINTEIEFRNKQYDGCFDELLKSLNNYYA